MAPFARVGARLLLGGSLGLYFVAECIERERGIDGDHVDLQAVERQIALFFAGLPFTLQYSSLFSSFAAQL